MEFITLYYLRASTILRNDPAWTSWTVTPAFSTSSGSIAPLLSARKKKLSNPCPVAASSKTSPLRVAFEACSTKFLSLVVDS